MVTVIDRSDFEMVRTLIMKYDTPDLLRLLAVFELQRRGEAQMMARFGMDGEEQSWNESAKLHNECANKLEDLADYIDKLFGE